MLRLLSIRNFVVVEALDLEFEPGFTVLTGETGAGKSILLDALGLLLGDRFELRQLRAGTDRAELAAAFDTGDHPAVAAWLGEQGYGDGDAVAGGEILIRRTLDGQGRSRAWVNGRPATLAQLAELGELLVDLHGQHAHQSLTAADAQRDLLDAFGGFSVLAGEVHSAWRSWRDALAECDAATRSDAAHRAERDSLEERRRELAALGLAPGEWAELAQTQSRLAHAAALLEASARAEEELAEGDAALVRRLGGIMASLGAGAQHDPALADVVALLEPARIGLVEAARELRSYRRRLDIDPAELARVEERITTLHDAGRRFRTRPEQLAELLAETEARLATLDTSTNATMLARRAADAEATFRTLAAQLSRKREFAASELGHRVTATMQELAMAGGRLEIVLAPLAAPAAHGCEQVEFRVAAHPKQPVGPLARIASGGELSRIALAIQVVTSEVGAVPTLVFDEVDTGIGGAVATTVGRLLQALAGRRQILCVTHLPQVAACADANYRVAKTDADGAVRIQVGRLSGSERIEEVARMLAGEAVTAKARAHARELLEAARRR